MQAQRSSPQKARHQWQLGQAHAKSGRWDEACRAFAVATRLDPQDTVYALNLARALLHDRRLGEAAKEAERAFRIAPRDPLACALWVHCLMESRRYEDAVNALRELPADVERGSDYHETLGRALQSCGRHKEAISAYFDALALKVDAPHLYYEVGLCFNELSLKEEASECFKTALALGIGKFELGVRGLLAYFKREVCAWDEAAQEIALLKQGVEHLTPDEAVPTTPFAHVTLFDSPEDQLVAARACCRVLQQKAAPLPPAPARTAAERAGRIRVGYVSADFHQHATSILMAEMLEHHDRERFEVTLYSHGPNDGSAMRQRIEASSEHFVDASKMPDPQLAARIREDGIDLLIDLKGHTRSNRLGLFASRPGRVQASFLGFPGTTGAEFIDYAIGDPVVTPMEHAAHFTEKLAQMPICYQPNDRQRARPEMPTRAECGLPEDKLVLCGFNQPYKISSEVFDVWCELLHRLPDAVLWLMEWNHQVASQLKAHAAARGVDPERLVWAQPIAPAKHIRRQQQADIFLDTWPCNAHTTASDALWCGVPVVTFIGRTFASRVAASLNHAVGLDGLICDSAEAYLQRVLQLAAAPALRQQLREHLLAGRDRFPLFDSLRFTRDIEGLYLRMVERYDAGLPPEHLPAA
jgi:predicted O-linked N-acetylglucosamine transferase (SPINDLY family)